MTEDELRKLFGEMRDEPVPADSLRRVRLAVAEKTQPRSWFAWWRVAAAVAAACLCVVLVRWRMPVVELPVAPKLVVRQEVAPLPVAEPVVVAPKPVRHVRAPKRVRPTRVQNAVDVIRIETPDPDVVIWLISD